MKIAIGADHAGFAAKESLRAWLSGKHDIVDCGTSGEEAVDYPDLAQKVAHLVSSGKADRGILICGTGIGMCMAANKVRHIRAALCHDRNTAELSRKHNDANVLCMGGRLLSPEKIIDITDAWLSAGFEGGRHGRRVEKIGKLEGGSI